MKKYIIWGTGKRAEKYLKWLQFEVNKDVEIVGFIDSNPSKWGKNFHGIRIYAPDNIIEVQFDYIDIWIVYSANSIRKRIMEEYHIAKECIRCVFDDFKELVYKMYRANEDKEIQKFMNIFMSQPTLEIYAFEPNEIFMEMEIFYDNDLGLRYVIFEGKRLYLSRKCNTFQGKNGKEYIRNIWEEQDLNSPHLYEEKEIEVNEGDVLIDAGACEGNFSLHNIDKVSKVYLIECDSDWMEALRATFEPYKEKVVFCDKFLSDTDTETTITLDTLVKEKADFIKMDIEGEEIKALNGAKRVLFENKHMKCSICAYHRHGDEDRIKQILNDKDFTTCVSKGYMLFIHDDDVWRFPELRRGIVRGYK